MTSNLTKIASLPGSGGGCMSALPAEVNQVLSQKADGWDGVPPDPGSVLLDMIEWQRNQRRLLAKHSQKPDPAKVQMKAAYFDHLEFPPIETPPTIEELAKRYLDAHKGLGC